MTMKRAKPPVIAKADLVKQKCGERRRSAWGVTVCVLPMNHDGPHSEFVEVDLGPSGLLRDEA